MPSWVRLLAWTLLVGVCARANGQQAPAEASSSQRARQMVQRAVRTELAADAADHSLWLYYETDRKPSDGVVQWVAQTGIAELDRVLQQDGHTFSVDQQRNRINSFIHDQAAQARQRKSGQHDDQQATQMLNMLPNAFLWTISSQHDSTTYLHFKPNPSFTPPTWESRVFAAMEGDMAVSDTDYRIVSLRGKLIREVKFAWGLLGALEPGGTFDVERRELAPGVWEITETHVHIQGHALIFKSISEQEDDIKSKFQQLPPTITFQVAAEKLMEQGQ